MRVLDSSLMLCIKYWGFSWFQKRIAIILPSRKKIKPRYIIPLSLELPGASHGPDPKKAHRAGRARKHKPCDGLRRLWPFQCHQAETGAFDSFSNSNRVKAGMGGTGVEIPVGIGTDFPTVALQPSLNSPLKKSILRSSRRKPGSQKCVKIPDSGSSPE